MSPSRGRVNLPVDPDQEARLRAAAEANGETLTGFLLSAAAERADEVLARAGQVAVGSTAFERFVAALDNDTEPMPVLSRYAEAPGPVRLDERRGDSGGRAALARPARGGA
jgi:uncharacterized protein (DUF1778 family)